MLAAKTITIRMHESINGHSNPIVEKLDISHKEVLTDHEILENGQSVSREEAMHMGELTVDELVIQKKLMRKIDSLIMPLVILVYLMNYIDRCVDLAGSMGLQLLTRGLETITLQPDFKVLKKT